MLSRKYSPLPVAIIGLLLLCIIVHPQGKNQQAQTLLQPSMMRLNVLVLDGKNHPVPDLRQEDFQVLDGDVPQTISFFSKEDLPVSYGFLVDTSGSVRSQFNDVLEAGRAVISNQRADDESFLIRFISSDKIQLANEFTTDKTALLDKLNSFRTEGGQTAIIDTLYLSADHLAQHKQEEDMTRRRRALILISDGEDRGGHFHKEELVKLLRKSNIQIFAIGLTKELNGEGSLTRKSPRDQAIALLEELANATGGRAFFPNSSSDIRDVAAEIIACLHTQYIIGYNPAGQIGKALNRRVRIKLTDAPGHNKLKVAVGPGYPVPQT